MPLTTLPIWKVRLLNASVTMRIHLRVRGLLHGYLLQLSIGSQNPRDHDQLARIGCGEFRCKFRRHDRLLHLVDLGGLARAVERLIRVETPVLYFYSPRDVTVSARVSFSNTRTQVS